MYVRRRLGVRAALGWGRREQRAMRVALLVWLPTLMSMLSQSVAGPARRSAPICRINSRIWSLPLAVSFHVLPVPAPARE